MKKRFLTAFLTLVMLLGCLTTGVSAAWSDKVDADENPIIPYMSQVYVNPEQKLADMIMVKEEKGYQLWFEEFTGEIALVDTASGQVLFSNPIDFGSNKKISENIKQKLLSQLTITYKDNDATKDMYSYKEAALRGQITWKNIKGGIRVEYTLGEPQTIRLVPRLINKDRFETMILANIENEWERGKVESFYTLKDPFDTKQTDRALIEMQSKFPVTSEMAIYVCAPDINTRELREVEGYIKKWCPKYTYEELDYDHNLTQYAGADAAPPRFRMALEYRITDNGMEVILPANSIEFDESAFQFETVQILPYLGAGNNTYTGYNVIPDGSGTLIRFEDTKGQTYNVSGQMYGEDFAYHTIRGQHSEVMRWPYYGTVTNYGEYGPLLDSTEKLPDGKPVDVKDSDGNVTTYTPITYSNGFMAIVTEGDSLATLFSESGGTQHPYNSVYCKFTPRPSDSYNLADSISVSGNATWSVTSDRRYTDKYTIRYVMLTDPKIAEEKNLKNTYETTWKGMAEALRDYWTDTGVLSKLENVKEDLPLFIESFGAMETLERVLSFPVETATPLTTFEDIKTMNTELNELGVRNINFKLTGFYNGTLQYFTYPVKLKWTKELGGADGFRELLQYAAENGVGIYPDFDFANINWTDLFDGVSMKRDAVKTIDDRYTVRRVYDPATQAFDRSFALCVSPRSYDSLYTKFQKEYSKYENSAISVSTMGTDLNSDFDEDEPYHREDNKTFTKKLLNRIRDDYSSVMTEGGNAYALPYVDIITDVSLESSQYVRASESIPFTGFVLHGSKVLTGTAANMEGDIDEMILRSIENGAALNFTLSYQNTNRMKEGYATSVYYSVNYEIWKEDVARYYTVLNEATRDLQDKYIVDHDFLDAKRIPDEDEKIAEEEAAAQAAIEKAEADAIAAEKRARLERLAKRWKEAGYDWEIVLEDTTTTTTDTTTTDTTDTTDDTTDTTTTDPDALEEDDNNGLDEFGEVIEEEKKEQVVVDKYATVSGSVVMVQYEGGVSFILNYNSFDVEATYAGKTYTVPGMSFLRIG